MNSSNNIQSREKRKGSRVKTAVGYHPTAHRLNLLLFSSWYTEPSHWACALPGLTPPPHSPLIKDSSLPPSPCCSHIHSPILMKRMGGVPGGEEGDGGSMMGKVGKGNGKIKEGGVAAAAVIHSCESPEAWRRESIQFNLYLYMVSPIHQNLSQNMTLKICFFYTSQSREIWKTYIFILNIIMCINLWYIIVILSYCIVVQQIS